MANPTNSVFKPLFLPNPGVPAIRWATWYAMFQDFLLASSFPADQEERKAALLRSNLGTEGYQIFASLTKGNRQDIDQTVAILKAQFDRQSTAIFDRSKFARRTLQPGETIIEFITSLKEMANRCNFEDVQFEIRVRDQFMPYIMSDKIRELLYQEPDTPTPNGAIKKAVTLERAMSEALPGKASASLGLSSSIVSDNHAVHGIKSCGQRSASQLSRRNCFACGSDKHLAQSSHYPAKGTQCRSCGCFGHYARVYRKSGRAPSAMRNISLRNGSNSQVAFQSGQTSVDSRRKVSIVGVDDSKSMCIVTCLLDDILVKLTLDRRGGGLVCHY